MKSPGRQEGARRGNLVRTSEPTSPPKLSAKRWMQRISVRFENRPLNTISQAEPRLSSTRISSNARRFLFDCGHRNQGGHLLNPRDEWGVSYGKVFDHCASGLGSVLDLYRRRDHVDRVSALSSQ
jgi:hypothetical protein